MRTLNDYFIYGKIEDVSTAGQIYIPVPDDGKIIKIMSALNGALGTADAVLTSKIDGTAVTDGAITITNQAVQLVIRIVVHLQRLITLLRAINLRLKPTVRRPIRLAWISASS